MMRVWRIALPAFLAGCLAGGFVGARCQRAAFHRFWSHGPDAQRMLRRLNRTLSLDPRQQETVKTVIEKHREKMLGLHREMSAKLSAARCDLMVLPELFASGYQFVSKDEVTALAEPVPDGPTTRRLCEMAKSRSLHIVAGLPERDGGRYYNSAVVVGPKGVIGCYRKTHLFFEETQFFTPGDTGFQV